MLPPKLTAGDALRAGPETAQAAEGMSDRRAEPEAGPVMAMQVIVFASQKGGSGKTTLCGQLAVQADLVNAGPVALIDTDPQGSLADWWNARESETPVFVRTDFARLMEDLSKLRKAGIRLVFVDTPPAVTDTIREIVSYAHLVVIPTRPSPHDLRAVGATVDIIDSQEKRLIFAVNAATPRARITAEAAVALSQHGTVAPVTIHQRTDFATSMIDGRTVMELNPNSKSAAEIIELWQYIASRLGRVERRRAPLAYSGDERREPEGPRTFGKRVPAPVFGRRVSD